MTLNRPLAQTLNIHRDPLLNPRLDQRVQPVERALGTLGAYATVRRESGVPISESKDEELLLG